jgi:hypothetical protein
MLGVISPTIVLAPARWVWSIVRRATESHEAGKRQLRQEMMDAARDFTTGVQQAIMGTRETLQRPARELSDVSVVWNAQPGVERLVGEAEARLARVQLAFGPASATGFAANAAVKDLSRAARLLGMMSNDLEGAARAADNAESYLREFNAEAYRAVRA